MFLIRWYIPYDDGEKMAGCVGGGGRGDRRGCAALGPVLSFFHLLFLPPSPPPPYPAHVILWGIWGWGESGKGKTPRAWPPGNFFSFNVRS